LPSVRVVTGGSVGWCEWLASVPFTALAESVAAGSTALVPNLRDATFFWPGLITAVRERNARQVDALKSAGLQHLLNRQNNDDALPLAACSLATPERRVADRES